MCEDQTVCLWDAYRLVKLQTIRDTDTDMHIPKFSSASFDHQDGTLYVGDQILNCWNATVDSNVEINALQIQTLSTAIAKERNLEPLIELSKQTMKRPLETTEEKSGIVLISTKSSLVDLLVDEQAT